jgi:hypothetical protein
LSKANLPPTSMMTTTGSRKRRLCWPRRKRSCPFPRSRSSASTTTIADGTKVGDTGYVALVCCRLRLTNLVSSKNTSAKVTVESVPILRSGENDVWRDYSFVFVPIAVLIVSRSECLIQCGPENASH